MEPVAAGRFAFRVAGFVLAAMGGTSVFWVPATCGGRWFCDKVEL
jgi:hypothetical protein